MKLFKALRESHIKALLDGDMKTYIETGDKLKAMLKVKP